MKACPYCAEQIQDEAVVCRYCSRDLRTGTVPVAPVNVTVAAPAARSRGCSPIVLIVVIIIVVVAGLSAVGNSSRTTSAPTVTSYTITYRVTGSTNSASLTYENETGGTEQAKVSVPWTKTFTAKPGAYLYISAQNEHDGGTIKCEILVNKIVAKQSESSGGYVIASCSGRL